MSLLLVSIAVDKFRILKYSEQEIYRSSIKIIKDEKYRKEIKNSIRCICIIGFTEKRNNGVESIEILGNNFPR